MAAKAVSSKSTDQRIAHALSHPIRVDVLAILCERIASPTEIAKILGEDVSKVGHHVAVLLEDGSIELVDEEKRRGAVEHYYRASLRPEISDEEWASLSQAARDEITALMFQAIVAEGLGAIRAKTFDSRLNRHLSWRALTVDDDGFDELARHKANSLLEVQAIGARSAARQAKTGEEAFPVIVAAMVFERASPGRAERNLRIASGS